MRRTPVEKEGARSSQSECARLCILVLALTVPSPNCLSHKRLDPGTVSRQSVHLLWGGGRRLGEACVWCDGWLEARDFFNGLKRVDSPGGPEFRKGSRVFTFFPDDVSLRFSAIAVRCSEDMKYVDEWPTSTPEFVKSFRAEARYIRDLHLHPLDINLAEEGTTTFLHHTFWSYRFVINTKGVRLTDTLVVYLYSKDGQKMGQFTVDLAGRTGLW